MSRISASSMSQINSPTPDDASLNQDDECVEMRSRSDHEEMSERHESSGDERDLYETHDLLCLSVCQ